MNEHACNNRISRIQSEISSEAFFYAENICVQPDAEQNIHLLRSIRFRVIFGARRFRNTLPYLLDATRNNENARRYNRFPDNGKCFPSNFDKCTQLRIDKFLKERGKEKEGDALCACMQTREQCISHTRVRYCRGIVRKREMILRISNFQKHSQFTECAFPKKLSSIHIIVEI